MVASNFLLFMGDDIAKVLSLIFKKSMEESDLPKDWKQAYVVPLFKRGKKGDVTNYRPISLTSQVCKVLKSLIKDAIVLHLEKHTHN